MGLAANSIDLLVPSRNIIEYKTIKFIFNVNYPAKGFKFIRRFYFKIDLIRQINRKLLILCSNDNGISHVLL